MLPRRVFMLWLQGWDQAPPIVLRARDSWILHNPGWEIVCLDADSLPKWLDVPIPESIERAVVHREVKPVATADIARLMLLNKHGGVWADGTLLCVRPLDEWVDEAVAPEGFWVYHGGDGRRPELWFMLSQPGSLITSRWVAAAHQFWATIPGAYEYFWLDRLFLRLAQTDPEFLSSWKRVPTIVAEPPPGDAATLGLRAFDPPDERLLQAVRDAAPFVLKLSWHGEFRPDTNAWEISEWAMNPRVGPPVVWQEPPCFDRIDWLMPSEFIVGDKVWRITGEVDEHGRIVVDEDNKIGWLIAQ